ncbi:Polysaccharide deacetylase [Tropicibacter naphthalenivorans]|uniref:Chitooligosaccharide deacetylase n=2 Tax=Tropicibacter naphthalenivorans TaxID=441103 RepID=A0A0P1FZZ8_9RHOB|nr:outer membrane N-deacetylase [Tropicibacter naphthalenivorans]SMC47875.1 Polysaccharide deacetylase [Tropicibacter naphthalenivorans]
MRLAAGGLALCVALWLAVIGLGWAALALTVGTLLLLSRRRSVPVIVYHSVSPDASWLPWSANISVRPEVFRRHMQVLSRCGYRVVRDDDLYAGKLDPRRRQVVLHFDDAYHDVTLHALPLLRQLGFPATVLASTDFIDPAEAPRDPARPVGYMTAAELRAIDADPLFKVSCHGKDHALGPVPGPATPRNPHTWGLETANLWFYMPGNKARWFEQDPPDLPQIPASDSVLTARLLTEDGQETETQRSSRVRRDLGEARATLSELLGREVRGLCWPFDRVTPTALADAQAAGFARFTGGRADNPGNRPIVSVSRTHMHDHAAGDTPDWIEALVFRARVEIAAGNLLWCPVSWMATLRRRSSGKYLKFRTL